MIDFSRLPPVIPEGIDPRLRAIAELVPPGARVIFAGPDREFMAALRRTYRLPLPCRDVLIAQLAGLVLITVAPVDEHDDGLMLSLTPSPDGQVFVTPVLIFTIARLKGAAKRLRPKRDYADRTVAALEELIFRHVLPAEVVS